MLSEELYQTIKAFALTQMGKTKDPQHDAKHVERVKNNALQILKLLDLEKKIDLNLLKIICLLHDITYTVKKPSLYTYVFEGSLEKRILHQALKRFTLSPRNLQTITEAVHHHTHSFPFRRLNKDRGIYVKILQDADTLDLFSQTRVQALRGLKRKLGGWLIRYGKMNLGKFLNYPSLAKNYYV